MLRYDRLWINKCEKRSKNYKGRENYHGKDQKAYREFKGCREIKSISNDSACYDIIFSVGGTDLDISDPFNIEKITEVWSPSLEYLQDLETMTAKYRIKQYQHLVESDAAVMTSCEEEIQKLESQIQDTGANLDAIMSADSDAQKGQDDYEAANAAWEDYFMW